MKSLANIQSGDIKVKDAEAKKYLVEFLSDYGKPSFGSMSKRDIDLAIFGMLQKLKYISANPSIYEVVQTLKVTRAKARNLIYESSLRQIQGNEMDKELIEALCQPVYLESSDKMIGIEIDNPLLIDHLKFKLRDLHHITDGSFNQDMIKLTPKALGDLLETYTDKFKTKEIEKYLKEAGVTVYKGKLQETFTNLYAKFKEKSTDVAIEEILKHVGKILIKAAVIAL